MNKHAVLALLFAVSATVASAVIIQIDLQGQAGNGLLPGNETGTVTGTPGTGGEILGGIFFDDSTNDLTINVGWGSGNGFTDLTGVATAAHIHGPTANNAPASFTENAGVLIGLTIADTSASAGYISGTYNLTATQAGYLMAGRLYINVHTGANTPGEIRGQLIAIPEPSTYAALLGVAGLAAVAWRRRGTRLA